MNKIRFALLIVFLNSFTTRADSGSERKFAFGVGWEQHSYGYGLLLEAQSPTIYSWTNNYGFFTHINSYLALADHAIQNHYLDEDGKYQELENYTASLGVNIEFPRINETFIGSYAQIGVVTLFPNNKLAKTSSSGLEVTIGIDFFSYLVKTTQQPGALFIQSTLTSGLGSADKLAGEPDLFNGVSMALGSRIFW